MMPSAENELEGGKSTSRLMRIILYDVHSDFIGSEMDNRYFVCFTKLTMSSDQKVFGLHLKKLKMDKK